MPLAATPEPIADGVVRSVVAEGSRAFVVLDDGRVVTVRREQVTPLVPLDRVLAVGMTVHGVLEAGGKELRIALETPSQARLDATFADGTVTPALVTQVGELGGELALHPDLRVRISRSDISSNRNDRVDTLLAVGETVPARVLRHSDGTIRLRLIDVDDDEPVQAALVLLPGGPEWLEFPPEVAEVVDLPVPTPPADVLTEVADAVNGRSALKAALLALETERASRVRLEQELDAARATSPAQMREVLAELGKALHDKDELAADVRAARSEVADLRKAKRDAARTTSTARDRRGLFGSAEDWIRHELYLAYIERVAHQDRAAFPMSADFVIGDRFATSLEVLDDGCLDKALRTCVDVLTGRATAVNGRQVHPLRTSEVGNAPQRVREDGARCFRCAIENGTPSARRLHWWKRRDGVLELSRVVLHDDMNP